MSLIASIDIVSTKKFEKGVRPWILHCKLSQRNLDCHMTEAWLWVHTIPLRTNVSNPNELYPYKIKIKSSWYDLPFKILWSLVVDASLYPLTKISEYFNYHKVKIKIMGANNQSTLEVSNVNTRINTLPNHYVQLEFLAVHFGRTIYYLFFKISQKYAYFS